MPFLDVALPQAAAGTVVAAVAASLAWWITEKYGRSRARAQARYERNLAAAEELYRAYGKFFTAWKAWEFHSKDAPGAPAIRLPQDHARVSELVELAAAAEGNYESLLVRLAVEQRLGRDQMATLWCLRGAMKELRYAIRQGKPLEWWRSDIHAESGFKEYQTFKRLNAAVAAILVEPVPRKVQQPTAPHRRETLDIITGDGAEFSRGRTGWLDLGCDLTASVQHPLQATPVPSSPAKPG